jgi:hypothetical protein
MFCFDNVMRIFQYIHTFDTGCNNRAAPIAPASRELLTVSMVRPVMSASIWQVTGDDKWAFSAHKARGVSASESE